MMPPFFAFILNEITENNWIMTEDR